MCFLLLLFHFSQCFIGIEPDASKKILVKQYSRQRARRRSATFAIFLVDALVERTAESCGKRLHEIAKQTHYE